MQDFVHQPYVRNNVRKTVRKNARKKVISEDMSNNVRKTVRTKCQEDMPERMSEDVVPWMDTWKIWGMSLTMQSAIEHFTDKPDTDGRRKRRRKRGGGDVADMKCNNLHLTDTLHGSLGITTRYGKTRKTRDHSIIGGGSNFFHPDPWRDGPT